MEPVFTTPPGKVIGAIPSMTPEEFEKVMTKYTDSILKHISKKLDNELKLEDLDDDEEEVMPQVKEEKFPNTLSLYKYLLNIISEHGVDKLKEEGYWTLFLLY